MKSAIAALLFFLAVLCKPALAESYGCPGEGRTGKEAVQYHDLVFQGKISHVQKPIFGHSFLTAVLDALTVPSHQTTFDVTSIIKGPLVSSVRIYQPYESYRNYINWKTGQELTVFARRDKKNNIYFVYPICRRMVYSHTDENTRPDLEEAIHFYKTALETAEAGIHQNQLSAYEEKSRILGEMRDHARAIAAYETLILKASTLENPDVGQRKERGCRGMEQPTRSEIQKVYQSFPQFGEARYFNGYGRALFAQGNYLKALYPLCLAKTYSTDRNFDKWFIHDLLMLGLGNKISNRPLYLPDTDLPPLDFSETNLRNSDLSNSSAYMNLKNVDMSGSNFRGAKISGIFENVDFTGADFTDAQFFVHSAKNLNLTRANFTKAEVTSLENATLQDTNFTEASFRAGYIRNINGTKPVKVDFSHQNLAGANLRELNLDSSKFREANLEGAHFNASSLRNADFTGANLLNTDFRSGSWRPTDVRDTNFSNTQLDKALLESARYNCHTIFPDRFDPPAHTMALLEGPCNNSKGVLTSLNFSADKSLLTPEKNFRTTTVHGNFNGLDFPRSNFRGQAVFADLAETNLAGSDFRHAPYIKNVGGSILDDADFSYANLKETQLGSDKSPTSFKRTKFFCARFGHWVSTKLDLDKADMTGAIFNTVGGRSRWEFAFNPIERKILYTDMQYLIDKFGPADYSGMDFSKCTLKWINFGATKLQRTKFKGANLIYTDFSNADLTGADFRGAAISHDTTRFPKDFDIKNAGMVYISNGSPPWGASVQRSGKAYWVDRPSMVPVPNFVNDNLDFINYKGAWLKGTDMHDSSLKFTNLQQSNLIGANLSGTDMTGAGLFDAVLDNADLVNANMYGADLRRARLTDANLQNTNLENAIYDKDTVWPKGFDPKQSGAYFMQQETRFPFSASNE